MTISLLIHTENEEKFSKLLDLIDSHPERTNFTINLHCKGYIPWENETLKSRILSFNTYYAFPTPKNPVESIVELISKIKNEKIIILHDDVEKIPTTTWDENYDSLYCNTDDLKNFNFDTKYNSIRWFIIDLLSQKKLQKINHSEESYDSNRYDKKVDSHLFLERIIYVSGGMGDHIMALPLIEKLSSQIYVSCNYPHLLSHIPVKGFVDWNDDLFGGYKRSVYEYGSSNNSKTIVDAFFEMYNVQRSEKDVMIYKGERQENPQIPTDKKIALICTSAAKIDGKDSNKDWFDIRWLKLVNELKKKDYFVIQVGSSKDSQIPNVNYKFLDRHISNLSKLIEDCSVWFTVDTFFHHLAASIKPEIGVCLTPFYNDHAKHKGVKYIEKDCGKNYSDRKWWLDLQQPERKECMNLIGVDCVVKKIPRLKKIVFYSAGSIEDNCSNWRIIQQFTGLDGFEIIHKSIIDVSSNDDYSADVVLIQRPILNCLDYVKRLRQNGVKVILDYDDPLPLVHNGDPSYQQSFSEIIGLLNNCDLITTTNEPMKFYFNLHSKTECIVLPNVINGNFISEDKKINEDKIILGWFGSSGHIESTKIFNSAVMKVLNEYDNVFLNIYTDNIEIYNLLQHEKTKFIPYDSDFIEFQKIIGEIDINLAPITEDYINLHKSNIRIILPGYKRIPFVASNFGEFKRLGKDCVLLCDSEEDWYNNLKLLIEDKELYNNYSKKIKTKVDNEFNFLNWVDYKKNLLNRIIDEQN